MKPKSQKRDQSSFIEIMLGVIAPLLFIAVILGADVIEGPKTAYVGVLSAIPMLSAVFARPALTAMVGAVTWLSAFEFGTLASDGNVTAQQVRLVIIGLMTAIAILAAYLRSSKEKAFYKSRIAAARAEAAEVLASTDLLTGQLNRRGLAEKLGIWSPEKRTVAVIDFDRLKLVNDKFGHLVGDECIKAICSRISANLKATDIFGRWGGDEFIIALPLGQEDALVVLERVVANSTGTPIVSGDASFQVTVSVGLAPWESGQTLDEVFLLADRALYEVKANGGGGIVFLPTTS